MYAGCFSVSIIHQTLTWTRGSLTCTQMLMHVIAHEGVQTHERDSSLKVDSGRKIPCRTGESNLPQWCDGLMLEPTELHPTTKDYRAECPCSLDELACDVLQLLCACTVSSFIFV